MAKRRGVAIWALVAVCIPAAAARGQDKHVLRERFEVGQQCKFVLTTAVQLELHLKQGDRPMVRRHTLNAEHTLYDHVLKLHTDGKPIMAARHYERAELKRDNNGTATTATLRPDRRFIVAQRIKDDTVAYSPRGPMTREEIDLVGEHFDVLMLAGVLPESPVAAGDTWDMPIPTAQALCGLDGVVDNKLKCKLDKVTEDHATFTVTGTAEGISVGSEVKLTVGATFLFDMKQEKLVAVNWKQNEVRNQGPVSSPLKLSLDVSVRRTIGAKCDELSPAVVGNVAAEPEAAYLLVHYRDAKGECEFLHDRGWHVLVADEQDLVMRLLDRGELIGQLNVSKLSRARPGSHVEAEELKRRAEAAPGFTVDQVLQTDEVPSDDGRWVYRHSVVGRANDVKLLQNYYAVAAPSGRQSLFVFTTEVDQADRLGGRDLAIVGSVTFPDKK